MPHPLLETLCRLPHRGAATPHERTAARLLAEHLQSRGAAVRLEGFMTPQTYATVVYWLLGGLLTGFGLVLTGGFLVGQLGLVISGLALVQAWLYFNWRTAMVTTLPAQKKAVNVLAQWPLPANVPVALHVILMAHYDTAPVSALYGQQQQKTFRASLILSLAVMSVGFLLAVAYTSGLRGPLVFWGLWAVITYLVIQGVVGTVGYLAQGYTNGASDNATGVVAAIETAVAVQEQCRRGMLPGTLVEVMLPSAEEAGMLGALAYLRKNRPLWPANGQKTIVINFDTLGAGKLTVVEQTGTVEVIRYENDLTRLATDMIRQPDFAAHAQVGRWHTADFDSVWFVRAGVPTLALCALAPNGTMPRIHRPDDTPEHLDPRPMQTAIALAVAVVGRWYQQFR